MRNMSERQKMWIRTQRNAKSVTMVPNQRLIPRQTLRTSRMKIERKSNAKNPSKAGKSSKKPQLSHEEMMKQGICFTCGEKGHISKKCPEKKNDAPSPESNSIRIRSNPQPSMANPQNDVTTLPVIPTISIGDDNAKPPPMYGY